VPSATASPTQTETATEISTDTPTETRRPTDTATSSPTPTATPLAEWPVYGDNHERTFFNGAERRITRQNAGSLRVKWRYLTGAVVTASPSVAYVDVLGEGRIKVVFVPSWDGNLYALRASNGSQLWHFTMKPHPGGAFPYASSAEIATVAGERRVYVSGGMTVYCLAAASGELRWEFDAGTGCTTCDDRTERNEVESSPTVAGGLVFFGMDVNDVQPGKGGAYALNAEDGRLVWYFDVVTGATCRPFSSDEVRRFDGFHTAAELGLPGDFFASRPGCDFDRSWVACGNIWSSFAVDARRRMVYTASSNCDTDEDPTTVEPPPPMPPHDEAIFALSFDGDPVWVWRPREVDNGDLAFGGVPNLFEAEIGGAPREVVGVGNKDGTYYVLDRDGVNEITGRIEPYWRTQVVPGGAIGGIIASAAVGGGRIYFSTAVGWSLNDPQRPAAWALRAGDGAVLWSNEAADPSFAPTTAIPDVAFMGSLFQGKLFGYDTQTGEQLFASPFLGGPVASAAAVLDGEVFVGAGVGARGSDTESASFKQSWIASPVTAFCLADAPDCPAQLCDDGDVCTYDFHAEQGCRSEPAPDGIPCRVGSQEGKCSGGVCRIGGAAS